MKTGIVIFAHGSSIGSANDSVRVVAECVALQGGFDLVEAAFLEREPRIWPEPSRAWPPGEPPGSWLSPIS